MGQEYRSRLRQLLEGSGASSPRPLSAQFTGKRQLLEALLLDAIRTFHLFVHARKPSEQQRFREVEEWIAADEADDMLSFVNVCAFLGVSASALRAHLLRWKAGQGRTPVEVTRTPRRQRRILHR